MLKVNGDSRFQDFLRVLAIGLEYSQTPFQLVTVVSTPEQSLSVFDYQKLCNILAGYRFVELLVLRENIGFPVLKSTALNDLSLPPSTNIRNIPQVCSLFFSDSPISRLLFRVLTGSRIGQLFSVPFEQPSTRMHWPVHRMISLMVQAAFSSSCVS